MSVGRISLPMPHGRLSIDPLIGEARDRQRWRRRRWLLLAAALVVIAGAAYGGFRSAGGGAPATAAVFHRAGITVGVPAGWFVTTAALNAITNPVPRFVLSSYRVPVGADAGNGYVPPSTAVLVQAVEEEPPLYSSSSLWPPRPAKLTIPPLRRMETLSGSRWAELHFRDGRRHLYLFIWIGRHASPTKIAQLLQALDRMQVDAR